VFDANLQAVIQEVDAECRRLKIPMLGPQKVSRFCEWIRAAKPNLVVEVGTAIGYSGLWIAGTLREMGEGRIITIELDAERAAEAGRHFSKAGVAASITQIVGDAVQRIAEIRETIDLLFLDGGFSNYYPCLLACQNQLRDGALLVADNAGIGAEEMKDYLDYVRQHCRSRIEWFETDLEWNPRDAMEISQWSMANDK
jgi:predicted O-methyltransferase YrrM